MPACPKCGEENPERSKFCSECGAPLVDAAVVEVAEERKVVTVLFCDLVGFTAASETADPEEVRARLVPYHGMLKTEIERYGGTVEKFIGDAVMAVFGAPIVHEDDPERAVRSGLRILDAIDELNAGDPRLALQVRIGINTGETVVTLNARPELGVGMVAGDVVNTASRLQGAAPVRALVVGERTYVATRAIFDYEALDPVVLKGKSDPVPIWRPIAARARFGVDVMRSTLSPLVGRGTDLTMLRAAFDKCVSERTVQMVTVGGEPGVGKSRLVAELLAVVDTFPGLVRWRQGRSLPYGDGVTFWALGEIVKAEAGILESDPLEVADRKLEAATPKGLDHAWLHQRLRPLVGMDAPEASRQENFTAWRRFLESLAEQQPSVFVFEDLHWADPALLEFLEHVTEFADGVPMLLVSTTRPELFERTPAFAAAARNAARVNLSPLSAAETAQLTANLLEQSVLPAEVQAAVVSRAGGNPLYAEEFIRLLVDTGILDRGDAGWRLDAMAEIPVPAGVQDLIAARLDTLTPERKRLLQDASVIGKVFWASALVAMADRDSGEVDRALHELSRKELVRTSRSSSMEGDTEHAFSHVLIRDVCYGQIPRALRASKHVSAAAWIEGRAGDRVEDHAEILASHYATALELQMAVGKEVSPELSVKAARMLQLAGDRALGTDVATAERHYREALRLAGADPTLLARHAESLHQRAEFADASLEYQRAIDGFMAAGDVRAAAVAMARSGRVLAHLSDPRGHVVADEAVALLDPLGPSPQLLDALIERAASHWVLDDLAATIADADRGLELAGGLGLPEPAELHGYRGSARVFLGDPGGLAEVQAALEDALARGLGHEAAMLQYGLCELVTMTVGVQPALELAKDGFAFARSRGIQDLELGFEIAQLDRLVDSGGWEEALQLVQALEPLFEKAESYLLIPARSARASIHLHRGSYEQSSVDTDWLVAGCREDGAEPQFAAIALPLAAATRLGMGERAESLSLLREFDSWPGLRANENYHLGLPDAVRTALAAGDLSLAHRLAAGEPLPLAFARHAMAAAMAALMEGDGDLGSAASAYEDVAQRWETYGVPWERAHALLGRGRCLLGVGSRAEALATLRSARDTFASLAAAPALAECDRLLAEATAKSS